MGKAVDINWIPNYPSVDIEFQNISYSVRKKGFKRGFSHILKSVSGKFYSGNLTAILGSSGAGKSSLLNILAGYVCSGVSGSIDINGSPRDMKLFKKMSAYIMQDDLLHNLLTVKETMMIAAKLKLSSDVTQRDKEKVVMEVMKIIGLISALDTRIENLSGGQRRRLSIALELVNNPPVIFLDEPTTGLDNVTMKQCIELLKSLTRQGRTVICTIHQPSDSLFNLFDQVYFMSDGRCIYNGTVPNLVPFLSSAGFPCPTTYSPADYIIELTYANRENISSLSELCDTKYTKVANGTPSQISSDIHGIYEQNSSLEESSYNFPTSFWTQVNVLLYRNFLRLTRNKTSLFIQFMHHFMSGVLMGCTFYGIGNNAALVYTNFRFCACVIIFFCYTYLMGPILVFPSEVKILRREYFNRWYSLKAYYIAMTLTPLPAMLLLGLMFTVIVYIMTDQPMNLNRFFWFTASVILVGTTSQNYGIAIGSVFNETNGTFIGAASAAPLALFCIYGMGYSRSLSSFMRIIIHFSYLRCGLEALCAALYNEREKLDCTDEIYCHFRDSTLFMKDVGMYGVSYQLQCLLIFFYTLLYMSAAYLFLRYRLTQEFSNKLLNYARNILDYKLIGRVNNL